MILSIVITILPLMFLVLLFGGAEVFRNRNIDQDGEPPIPSTIFYVSKYAIIILWVAASLHSWGINLAFVDIPLWLKNVSLCLWILGFMLLFSGRFGMGESFRIGSPKESTHLKVNGLFSISRNPMYLGVFTTLFAAVLFTLNPILLLVALFIIITHHKIVLAEEKYLLQEFGEEYQAYCSRVRRYI